MNNFKLSDIKTAKTDTSIGVFIFQHIYIYKLPKKCISDLRVDDAKSSILNQAQHGL